MGRVTALRIPCGLGRALGRDTDEHLIDEIAASAHANMRTASPVGPIRLGGSFGRRQRYPAIFRVYTSTAILPSERHTQFLTIA